MRKIETFATEEELLRRIEQLRADGVTEDMMTVVGNEGTTTDALDDTGVNYRSADGSAWDKIASWFSDDQPEDRVMDDLGLTKEEEDTFMNALDRGELLLYVNNRTTDDDTYYAGNDGSFEKDDAAPGAVPPAEDARRQENFDNRTVTEDAAPGKSEQFVPETHREDPLTKTSADYGIDQPVRDDNYSYDDNNVTEDERMRDDKFVTDEERRRNDNFGVTDEEWDRLSDEERIELREERLRVDKENVKTGEVHVDKHVETEHQEIDVPVERDEVTIERRPVEGERRTGSMDERIEDNDSIHIPVSEERVNVEKENVVDEEVVVRKNKVQDTEHISEDVRREEVDIEETTNTDRETRNRDDRDRL
ncbi:YsnF/AvaK domain-containing protein [Salinicoccus halitifaciens]|uniref:Uncharacterized protein (TIGR02271 family) n=1 Tax=Salinicoccus halitifaciens TaxID=1073415 RepID=A0ABV2EBE8_9STAP|nr:YsnF/AvaK domain-containing protein [Salinicoccus halitifaciens]MCD2137527.1 YsnF/AvaK domain-containing protein [Salinicoccus halitifaciens]